MDVPSGTDILPKISERPISAADRGRPNTLKKSQIVLLLLIVAAGAFLRFYRISTPSLWMDELWSIEMSMGRGSVHDHFAPGIIHTDSPSLTSLQIAAPWPAIWTHLAGYPHPPLYSLLLRAWMDCFGNGELAVRSLSAIFSCTAIPLLFDVCRQLRGPRIALLAAAIMSLAGSQIEFAQDARNYTLITFLGLASARIILRITAQRPKASRLILLVFFLTCLALTHYNSWGLIAALGIYAVIRAKPTWRFVTLLPFCACAVLIAITWLHWMLPQFAALPSTAHGYLAESSDSHKFATLIRATGLPGKFLVGDLFAPEMPSTFYVIVALLAVVVPIARLPWRPDQLLWIFWLGGTVGFVAAVDLARHSVELDYTRYTILASPAVYALLAGVDWPRRAIVRDAVPLIAIAILLLCAFARLGEPATPKEDWRTLLRDIDRNAAPNELLIFYGNDPWISPGAWYLALNYYAPDSHRPWLILNHPANAAILKQLSSRSMITLIGAYPRRDAAEWIPGFTPITEEQTTAGAFCRLARIRIIHRPSRAQ